MHESKCPQQDVIGTFIIDFKRSFLIKYVAARGCHIKKTFMAFTALMKQIWKAVFEEGTLSENDHLQHNSFYLRQFS